MEIRNPGQQPGHPVYGNTHSQQHQDSQNASAPEVSEMQHVIIENAYYDGETYVDETIEYDVPRAEKDQTSPSEPHVQAQQNAAQQGTNAQTPSVPPVQPPSDNSGYGYAPQPAPQPQYAYQASQEPSAFSKAWQDIKNTPDAVSSIGFKGLVNCVPILNFTVWGLGGKWAKDAADGKIEPMPKKTVDQENFVAGFYYLVISLVLGFILGLVNVVPIIGQIAFFVGCFFVTTFSIVMFQRYLAYGSFGEAFNIKDIWEKTTKRNFGELWVATFMPALIMSLISGAIAFVITFLFVGVGTFSVIASGASGSLGGILAGAGAMGIGGIISFIVVMFCNVISILWGMRGCGYWIQKNVPEWNSANAHAERAARIAAEQARAQQQYQQAQAQAQQYAQQQAYHQQQQQYVSYEQTPQPQQPVGQQQAMPQQAAQPVQNDQVVPPQQQ